LLARRTFTPVADNRDAVKDAIEKLKAESGACEADAVRLVSLFEAALKLPHLGEHLPEDCPLCGTTDAITVERLAWLNAQAQATESYQTARKALLDLLKRLTTLVDTAQQSARAALPILAQRF